MKKTLLISLFFLGQFLNAQYNYWEYSSDSLQTYLKKDTIRAKILVETIHFNSVRNFSRNISLIEELFSIAKKQKSQKYEVYALNSISEYHYNQGNYLQALDEGIKALKKAEEIEFNYGIRQAKLNIGKVEIDSKNFESAYKNFNDVLLGNHGQPTDFENSVLNLWLADYYVSKRERDYKEALNKLRISNEGFKKINSKVGLAIINSTKARIYKVRYLTNRNEKDLELSKKYALNPVKFYKKEKMFPYLAYAYYTQATTQSILGNHLQSIPLYKKSLKIYKSLGELFFNMKIEQHLFIAYSITQNQKEAIKVNKRYVLLKDSIFDIEKRRLIANAQAKFDNQKLKNEKQLAEIKEKRNRNLLVGSIVIGLLISLLVFLLYWSVKNKKRVEIAKLKLKQTENRLTLEKKYRFSELKALKSQMNPHFIFNALNSIQDYIVNNEKDLAGDYLGMFADLIRKYLSQSTKRRITLFEEIETLEMYLELEKLRFGNNLQYILQNDIENIENIELPTMLLQPFIENAIKHGLLHKKGVGILHVSFMKDQVYLICKIEDNGVGRKKSEKIKKQRSHVSFATQATRQRIDLLNHNKTKKIIIFIEDIYPKKEDTGTQVIVKIPLKFE